MFKVWLINTVNGFRRRFLGFKRPSKKQNITLLSKRNEDVSDFIFREAVESDIPKLSELHAITWSQTYPHVRRPPTAKLREHQWREQFSKLDGTWFCIVIEKLDGELIGFAKGKENDSPEYEGRLDKIYLLREYQRLGLGKKLVALVAERFINMGIHSMILFGEASNPSIAFHKAMGGKRFIGDDGEISGNFGWKNIDHLAKKEK